jgi:RNA polymerase sigma-70 factor, ECF subfamily
MTNTDCDMKVGTRHAESTLMSAVASGDRNAMERLIRENRSRMRIVAKRLIRVDDDADDAVQDALICAWRHAAGFRGESSLATWLHRVTVNACLMRIRSTRVEGKAFASTARRMFSIHAGDEANLCKDDSPLHGLVLKETCSAVREAIEGLPSVHREVLLLRDIDEFDTQTTATLLQTTTGTVKTRLHRARHALRAVLIDERDGQRSEG